MDEQFEIVWHALIENGSSKRNHDATEHFWNTLSQKQKDLVFQNIPRKVKEGKFVQYDPIRAIKENIRAYQMPEPTNYNGRTLKQGVTYVIAKYKGAFGMYSLQDAREFGMECKDGTIFK